ncbi:MAG: 7-cyano-7-deazaguanine synthase QueC [Planctomycetes bacterium]|nr:7-cyano-7-deazaguanine synthase QueC [Planctomycetota bacterium]
MTTAIATLSGGLDSAIAAALHREQSGCDLQRCLFFDYGQRARVRELGAAEALAQRWQVPLQVIAMPWLGELAARSGSALMPGQEPPPVGTIACPGDQSSARAVWVPARNAVFVSVAAAFAEAFGAEVVVTGFNREEAATFADNSAEFVAAAETFLGLGTRTGVRVISPTLTMDKNGIVAAARRLGFGADDFWSCYEGGAQPCGRCESCLRSRWQR